MICRKCGNQIPDDSLFCPRCGANCEAAVNDLQPESIIKPQNTEQQKSGILRSCPYCKVVIRGQETECPSCGKPLDTGNQRINIQPTNTQPANTQPAINRKIHKNTQNVYLNILLFTRIGAIPFLFMCIVLVFIVINALTPGCHSDQMPPEGAFIFGDGGWSVIFIIFFVIFCICGFIRLVCACILAAEKEAFGGMCLFIGVALGITILIGSLTQELIGDNTVIFIIFGFAIFAYLGWKIKEWY